MLLEVGRPGDRDPEQLADGAPRAVCPDDALRPDWRALAGLAIDDRRADARGVPLDRDARGLPTETVAERLIALAERAICRADLPPATA